MQCVHGLADIYDVDSQEWGRNEDRNYPAFVSLYCCCCCCCSLKNKNQFKTCAILIIWQEPRDLQLQQLEFLITESWWDHLYKHCIVKSILQANHLNHDILLIKIIFRWEIEDRRSFNELQESSCTIGILFASSSEG